MLFDLKGKRKRLVQVVYVGLAILFGGGLVLFGIGSGGISGGLIDAFQGNSGGGGGSVFDDNVERARAQVRRNPRSEEAWLNLVRTDYNLAASTEGSDAETGALTDKGRQSIIQAADAWERYLKLKPKKINVGTGQFAALAYGALQEYPKAVKTQQLIVKTKPNPNSWFQLADFAYRAGNVKLGDRAAARAVKLTPADQRNTVRSLIKETKTQDAQLAKAIAEQRKQAKKEGKSARGEAFGPLPGQGQSSGASP
jgi:tetratricopeptide (TPR) repeat protein